MAEWLVDRILKLKITADTEEEAVQKAKNLQIDTPDIKSLHNYTTYNSIKKLDENGNVMQCIHDTKDKKIVKKWYTPQCPYGIIDCIYDPAISSGETCKECEKGDMYDNETK